MKIDETTLHVVKTTGQNKVHVVMGTPNSGFDAIDLAFIDLLGQIGSPSAPEQAQADILKDIEETTLSARIQKTNPDADNTQSKEPVNALPPVEESNSVNPELFVLHNDLTDIDLQFIKDMVIPGLPILQGSVPLQSVFPMNKQGSFNFHGYEVSQKLAEMIQKGYKTGRPFRVEMDEKSSIIIKIRNGKVSAEFISSDRAAALHIKQELDELRARMMKKNLPVDVLSYRDQDDEGYQQQEPRYFNFTDDDDDDLFLI